MFVSSAGRRPAADRIASSRNAVVVFPFVPVTAATRSSRDGLPKKRDAATGIAARTSGTKSCGSGRSSGWSTTKAAAPSAAAVAAKACPSAFRPGTQKKRAPSVTERVSYARSEISIEAGSLDPPPTTSPAPSAAMKRSRFIRALTLMKGG